MLVGQGRHTYEWTEKWARIPDTESARTGWAHHGIVVSQTGDIITFHQGDPAVLVFDPEGNLTSSWRSDVDNAHGMSIVQEGNEELLWLADNTTGTVVETTLDGKTVMSLEKPDLAIYEDGRYSPTGVAVNEERHGGNGDIWLADGYGQSYVHRYDKGGRYMGSINGEEGEAGRFACPHAVWVDERKAARELYVADRSNGRVQVYDLDGTFLRAFGTGPGADWLHSPGGFAVSGEHMFIAELRGSRVSILDSEDGLVGYLGENSGAFKMLDGWPNISHEDLVPGRFNSPHGIATDAAGNVFVAEWLVGGRITKLARVG